MNNIPKRKKLVTYIGNSNKNSSNSNSRLIPNSNNEKWLASGRIINQYNKKKVEQDFDKWYNLNESYLSLIYNHIGNEVKFNIEYEDFCNILYHSNSSNSLNLS